MSSTIVSQGDPDIELRGVRFAYTGQREAVLDHLDWRVEEGRFVVVAGPSGSGKSTLLRCLNGLVPHFSGGQFGGRATVRGFDTRRAGPRVLSRAVGFVFQDPEAQSVAAIVDDELAFGMEQLGIPPPTMRKRVEEVLDLLGIADLRQRELATLSGGERQRVAVAAVLTLQPRILVMDEPTSQLDPWGAEDVISAVARLNADLGLTIVMAEHRLERVLSHADTLRFVGGPEPIEGAPRDVIRSMQPELLPPLIRLGVELGWQPPPITVKEGRQCVQIDGRLPASPGPDASIPGGAPIVEASNLTIGFGRQPVLHDLDVSIRPGEVVAMMGRNGSGKTTLLRTLMGFHRPTAGRVLVDGRDTRHSGPADLAAVAGYLPQRPSSLFFNQSVRGEVAFTLKHAARRGVDAERLIAELGLMELIDRHPSDLSAGEQERAALATVLAGDPRLLLLDEPTRGMDAARKRALAGLIRRLGGRGVAVVLVTHDIELVAECATRVMLLGNGGIIADGGPRSVLAGSLTFATQINKLYGDGFLTPNDVISGLERGL